MAELPVSYAEELHLPDKPRSSYQLAFVAQLWSAMVFYLYICPLNLIGLSECSGVACVAKKEDTSFGRAGAPICTTGLHFIIKCT